MIARAFQKFVCSRVPLAWLPGLLLGFVLSFPGVALAQSVGHSRDIPAAVVDEVQVLGERITQLSQEQQRLLSMVDPEASTTASRLDIFHGYIWVLLISFMITLLSTPIMRLLAVKYGVVDRPSDPRKVHKMPVAYLGGAAVFLGLIAGILYSYLAIPFPFLLDFHPVSDEHLQDGLHHFPVPPSILLGITVITVVGLVDDVVGVIPRVKVGGQLLAAAALAIDDVGVRLAGNVLGPIGHLFGNDKLLFSIPLPAPVLGVSEIPIDVIYWTGTALIAIFVLGACNASNLIDGLDGLLSGVTAIAGIGLLVVALTLAATDDGPRDAQRIILCMALVGACLGFLPHNFNPATIFLGDCGSLMLGFTTVVIILTLGNEGQTQLVLAGLIIYAVPIIDTTLAIVRRKLARKKMSDADSDHLHHMLKRALGVKGAVLSLYAIAGAFATLGVLLSEGRARVIYLLALVFASYIGVVAIKTARRKAIEEQTARYEAARAGLEATPYGGGVISTPGVESSPPASIIATPQVQAPQVDTPQPATSARAASPEPSSVTV
ncbi:MAG: MraY family glycosyltransferase [Planctomycetota bacterium]|nr:MraY family glycosyltransferase [Planctomycetota bacterium]